MKYVDLAQKAYEDYAEYTNWKNYQGLTMPQWEDLPEGVKNAWMNAAAAVTEMVLEKPEEAKEMLENEICPLNIRA